MVTAAYRTVLADSLARRGEAGDYGKVNPRPRQPADFDLGWAYTTILAENGDIEGAREVLTELQARFPGNPQLDALAGRLAGAP